MVYGCLATVSQIVSISNKSRSAPQQPCAVGLVVASAQSWALGSRGDLEVGDGSLGIGCVLRIFVLVFPSFHAPLPSGSCQGTSQVSPLLGMLDLGQVSYTAAGFPRAHLLLFFCSAAFHCVAVKSLWLLWGPHNLNLIINVRPHRGPLSSASLYPGATPHLHHLGTVPWALSPVSTRVGHYVLSCVIQLSMYALYASGLSWTGIPYNLGCRKVSGPQVPTG